VLYFVVMFTQSCTKNGTYTSFRVCSHHCHYSLYSRKKDPCYSKNYEFNESMTQKRILLCTSLSTLDWIRIQTQTNLVSKALFVLFLWIEGVWLVEFGN
jgi:hypothetical protein